MRRKHLLIASFLLVIIGLVSFSSLSLPVVATETMNLSPIADSDVDSDEPTTNYGAGLSLHVKFYDMTSEDERGNAYLLFDLTTLDTELFDISSATLELYTDMGSSPTAVSYTHLTLPTTPYV